MVCQHFSVTYPYIPATMVRHSDRCSHSGIRRINKIPEWTLVNSADNHWISSHLFCDINVSPLVIL